MEPCIGSIIKVEGYDHILIAKLESHWLVIRASKVYPANVLAIPVGG